MEPKFLVKRTEPTSRGHKTWSARVSGGPRAVTQGGVSGGPRAVTQGGVSGGPRAVTQGGVPPVLLGVSDVWRQADLENIEM